MTLNLNIKLHYFGDEIHAIRLGGEPHLDEKYIIQLRGKDDSWLSRAEVVSAIRGGHAFYAVKGPWRRELEVVDGGHNPDEDYVRTVPDSTTSNNLLSLPRE